MNVPGSMVNGAESSQLSVHDRGLHFGDGLFETMVSRDGRVLRFERHWERLLSGCARLGISPPERSQVLADIRRLVGQESSCLVKLIHTRGDAAGRGYRPSGAESPRTVLLRHAWQVPPQPFSVTVSSIRCADNPALAGIKHLNRLESVLAQRQLQGTGFSEAIMLSASGWVTCGSMTNLFLLEGDALVTPVISECGVFGTMRGCVMQAAQALGMPVREQRVGMESLQRATSLMVTNARLGLQPVDAFEGRRMQHDPRINELREWIETHAG